MKSAIIAGMYGSRAGEEEIKKVLTQLDTAKINNRFNDNYEGDG